jgi:hypothetical protein
MGLLTLGELSDLWISLPDGGRIEVPGYTSQGYSRSGIERAARAAEAPGFQRQRAFMDAFRRGMHYGRDSLSWTSFIQRFNTRADRDETRRLLRLHELTERRRREAAREARLNRAAALSRLVRREREEARQRRQEEADFWAQRRRAHALEATRTASALAAQRAGAPRVYGEELDASARGAARLPTASFTFVGPPAPAGWRPPASGTLVSSLPATAPGPTYGAF